MRHSQGSIANEEGPQSVLLYPSYRPSHREVVTEIPEQHHGTRSGRHQLELRYMSEVGTAAELSPGTTATQYGRQDDSRNSWRSLNDALSMQPSHSAMSTNALTNSRLHFAGVTYVNRPLKNKTCIPTDSQSFHPTKPPSPCLEYLCQH